MHIRQYIQTLGFTKDNGYIGTKMAIYMKDSIEILVPLQTTLADYSNRVADIILKLSQMQRRDPGIIISELLIPPSDILKFSIKEPSTETGTISLQEGISLLESSKKAILATACQIIDPQKYYKRLQRGDAEVFLDSCRMGQTEFGSFVVTISCPIRHETEQAKILQTIPFARKVTLGLITSVSEILSAIDADNLDRISNVQDNAVIASANLCEALLEMQPSDNSGQLVIGSIWSKQIPIQGSIPASISIRKDYFAQIEQISKSLRPTQELQGRQFVARVDSLHGGPDNNNQMSGEVALVFVHDEGEVIKARVHLKHESYMLAWKAHGENGYVCLKGTLIRGRLNKINDCSDFHILGEATE